MKHLILLAAFFFSLIGFSQNLNRYSFVIVPDRFEFQSQSHQYKLNEMAKFYFENNGFNAFLSSDRPEVNRCDGLYAEVVNVRAILGTRVEIVLKDCNQVEIYRSAEGRSKYKEFEKAYQDALRKAFNSFKTLNVQQKAVELSEPVEKEKTSNDSEKYRIDESIEDALTEKTIKNRLPTGSLTAFYSQNESFILRKTAEGYSFYQETDTEESGLLLIGKIVITDNLIKYVGVSGEEGDVHIDKEGNILIKSESGQKIYKKMK